MIALNIQRLEHNNLATIWRENPWVVQEPPVCKNLETQMQTLTRMDMVVMKDNYHMTTMDENVKWTTLTHLLSIFPPNLKAPFCTSTLASWLLILFWNVHTGENYTSPFHIQCMLMPQILPLLTLPLVRTWHKESTPR